MTPDGENGPKVARARAREIGVLKKTADLLELIGDHDASRAVEVLREGMLAEKTFWDRETDAWITQPDFKERREAALAVLAYKFGKPIERQIQLQGSFEELGVMMNRLSGSPAAVRAMERIGVAPKLLTEGTQGNESGDEKADSPKGKTKKKDSKS